MADFYLRDEKLVHGRLISEDRNKVTIEELSGSTIVVSTYSKRDIDTRTLRIKNVPEARYYADLGEYFHGRTWDFRDDPDDFIQAIRSYETARRALAETYGEESERLDEINRKIERVKADRAVWIREAESRARLKKLEFEAEIENRLAGLENAVDAQNRELDKVAGIQAGLERLERDFYETSRHLSGQLAVLDDRTASNRRLLDDFTYGQYYYRYYSSPYYYPRQHKPEDPNSRTKRRRGKLNRGFD
jgi:tetrahydromethanopterin S-methyltransferase subunit G